MLLGNPYSHDLRVQREAASLVAGGHQVTVWATAKADLPAEEMRGGVRVRRVPGPSWLSWSGPLRLYLLARWYSRYVFLAEAAARSSPDIVHGHDLETLMAAGQLAARLGIPHIHDDHELGLEKLAQWLIPPGLTGARRAGIQALLPLVRLRGRQVETRWIPRAAGVITVSDMCGRLLKDRYGVEPVIVRNLPRRSEPLADPRLRERAGVTAATRIALYQGTITDACAPEVCISAARTFPDGWVLVFLGAAWLRPRLEAQVRDEGLSDRVQFVDRVPPEELPGFTRAADIGLTLIRPLNPAERYGLGNKLFEYLHAGLPVVTTEGTAQAELVKEADVGVVIPEITPEAVAQAVRVLAARLDAEGPEGRDRRRAMARERWCWEEESKKLVRLYDSVLRARKVS